MPGTKMWSHLDGALVEHFLGITLLPEWALCSRSQNKAQQQQECTHPPHREALCAPAPMANVSLLRGLFGVTSAWAVSSLISLGSSVQASCCSHVGCLSGQLSCHLSQEVERKGNSNPSFLLEAGPSGQDACSPGGAWALRSSSFQLTQLLLCFPG